MKTTSVRDQLGSIKDQLVKRRSTIRQEIIAKNEELRSVETELALITEISGKLPFQSGATVTATPQAIDKVTKREKIWNAMCDANGRAMSALKIAQAALGIHDGRQVAPLLMVMEKEGHVKQLPDLTWTV